MKKTLISTALAGAALLAAPASAATVATIGDGQTFCESQTPSIWTNADCDLGGAADLGNTTSTGDELTFVGAGSLAGFVADANGVGNGLYPDYASIVLNEDSIITMTLFNAQAGFDALFTFGGAGSAILDGASTTASFFAAAGTYFFGIDATNPSDSATMVTSSYRLDVAPVPLPAGAVLLLTALGGLGAARRMKKA